MKKYQPDKFIIALDDAYYEKKNINYTYLNLIRRKLGLQRVKSPQVTFVSAFIKRLEDYFLKKYKSVKKVNNFYKNIIKKTIGLGIIKVKDFGLSDYDKKIFKKVFYVKIK